MSATEAAAAPAPGGEASASSTLSSRDQRTSPSPRLSRPASVVPLHSDVSSPLSELGDEASPSSHIPNGRRVVKLEEHDEQSDGENRPPGGKSAEAEGSDDLATATALLPSVIEKPDDPKKRKRGPSPPWQFPIANTATIKTADGRRVSARVHPNTPPVSAENENPRGRSSSLSAPPHKPKLESPPWRKFEAAGPTSVMVDGKRKSSRVNRELTDTDPPKRVSPRSKRMDGKTHPAKASQAEVNRSNNPKTSAPLKENLAPKSASKAPTAAEKIASIRAQIHALTPSRSFTSPERSRQTSNHKRKHSADRPLTQLDGPASPKLHKFPPLAHHSLSPEMQHRPSPRIKLRFNTPRSPVPPPHPHAVFPTTIRPPSRSIFQVIEDYELQEQQQPYSENERGPPDLAWFIQRAERQAVEEGAMRRRILLEAESGGHLSKQKSTLFQDVDIQPEPPKQYGHNDWLVAHALHLRHLQLRERNAHRLLAKRVAQEALEFWKAKQGPTEEDLIEEQRKLARLVWKQVVVDLKTKWELVAQHVQSKRLQAWEREEERRRQVRLKQKLEWSENLVARLRGEGSEVETGEGSDEDEDDSEESVEENMSESSSEVDGGEEDEGVGDIEEMGEEELNAYLAQRESEVPAAYEDDETAQSRIEDDTEDVSMIDSESRHHLQSELEEMSLADLFGEGNAEEAEETRDEEFQLHESAAEEMEIDDHANDIVHSHRRSRRSSATPAHVHDGDDEQDFSSDESTNMDSTDYDSDEDMSGTDDDVDAENGVDEEDGEGSDAEQLVPRNSLLSLFKAEIKEASKATGLPTPTTSAEGDEGEGQVDAGATLDVVHGESALMHEESADVADAVDDPQQVTSTSRSPTESVLDDAASSKHLVPSPALLRGTLRSYQHAGLDWLASLYRNGTNGILADEMGLGKTIQTIALLGHLAEEHACWDTHLIVVPTSVVLNWVTEFQKFLPGFRVLGYYGSSEERQLKRKGWVNDPHHESKDKRGYNVVITSYNVAMQDINALRNVQWHYLVLDEAHNIRNFNSQRWQVLIRLKTKARLLLTGTPLQNSLTELWSLLTFLTAGDDDPQHGDLEEFLSHWKEPVKEIFDRGVQSLSSEAQRVVDQLHVSLRPFLLRRLKSEVEKDLPTKTEQVVVCKLSKRQRQLYQEYMGLAETRRHLTQGNAVTAGKVLLSLRRVCNHPDLFEPREVQTGWGMERGVADGFESVERLVRKLLGLEERGSTMRITLWEERRGYATKRSRRLDAASMLEKEAAELEQLNSLQPEPDLLTLEGSLAFQRLKRRQRKLEQLRSCIRVSRESLQHSPVYGSDLRELVTIQHDRPYRIAVKDVRGRVLARHLRGWPALGQYPLKFEMDHVADWTLSKATFLQQSVETFDTYAERMQDTLVRFAFCTPNVTAPILNYSIPPRSQQLIRASSAYPAESDYAHEARIRTSIVFPDSRLLIYDAGKLQRLTHLLRELQSRGSRSLIFTQMTGTLNILEQFLSILGLPYLRLDGSTPVERRQLYSAEFNRPDSKYQCMILSSRAGGVGLNLVGASSVIFYDLDWNPQMDRQCMDRAHRIGQVRDVMVYKMVSEKTVEENILRRAEQKSFLDQTVIQEGRFTTEYPSRGGAKVLDEDEDEEGEDVAKAIERFLGGNEKAANIALESVEDREDVAAAQQARKEEQVQDDADLADHQGRSSKGPSRPPTPGGVNDAHAIDGEVADVGVDGERKGHVDLFMIKMMERLLEDVPFVPPAVRKTDRHGRDRKRKR